MSCCVLVTNPYNFVLGLFRKKKFSTITHVVNKMVFPTMATTALFSHHGTKKPMAQWKKLSVFTHTLSECLHLLSQCLGCCSILCSISEL